jgi:3-oxoacyl-[acyl-carrier protein] reductase
LGYLVPVFYRHVYAAADLASQLNGAGGGRGVVVPCDVSDEESIATAVASLVQETGRVDALVNNAGIITPEKPLAAVSADEFDAILAVNLRGTFLMTRAVVPYMVEVGYGRVVNIASRSWLGGAGLAAYAASKGGVISLTRSFAMELGRYGVTCNAVSPSLVQTPLFWSMPEEERRADLDKTLNNPIPRAGTVEDIANAVSFFCQPASGFVTGQHLYVSGGADLLTSGTGI